MTERRTRVVVVDDHPVVRDGLAMLIATTPDLQVVGTAGTAQDAIDTVTRLQPDVVLMDLALPDRTGYAATRELALDAPRSRVLVLTMDRSRAAVTAAIDAGARGYMLKESEASDILTAVRAVAAGQLVIDPQLAAAAASAIAYGPDARDRLFPELSAREFQVLRQLVQEDDLTRTAALLGISVKTVQNLVSRVLLKLRVATREEALQRARAAGLG